MRPMAPLVALLGALVTGGCGADCPAGTAPDLARRARLGALLARTPAADLALPPACFGDAAEPALGEDGRARLPAALPDPEAAAWLAHLAHHRAHGLPTRHLADRPCEQALALAAADEVAALALERQVRAALGAAAPDDEARLARALAGYRARCR